MQHLNSKQRPSRTKPISTIKSQFHTLISKPTPPTSTSSSINIISNRHSITNIKPTNQRYTLSTSLLSTQHLKPLTHTSYRSLSTTNPTENQDSSTTTTHSSNTTQQSQSTTTTTTTTPVKKLTFQQAYNRFVLAIHPDLFQPWPKAHDANTIALGLLNEIFTGAKDNNLNGKVLNLTFYVKNNIDTNNNNDDDDNHDNDDTNENKQTNSNNKKQKKKSTSTLKSTSRITNDDIPLDTIKTTITIPNINPRDGGVPESTFKKATGDYDEDEKMKKKKSKRHLTIEVPKSHTSQLPRAPATYNHTQLLYNLTQLFHLIGINVDEHAIDRFEFIYGFEPTNTDQVQIDHQTGQPRIINEGLHIQRSVNSAFFNQSQENPISGKYTQQTGFYGFRGKYVDRDDQGHAPDYLIHVLDPRHRVKPIEFPSDFSLIEFIGVTKHHAKKTALATKLHPRSKIIESQLRHRGFKLLFQRFLHPIDHDAGNQGHINAMTQFVKMLRYYFPDYTASGQFEENMSHLPQTPADLVKQAEREYQQSKPHAKSDDPNDIFVVRDREMEENAKRDEENRKKGIFIIKDEKSNEIISDEVLMNTLRTNEPENRLAYQLLLQRQKLQSEKQQKEYNERIERESDVKGHYINPIQDDPNDIVPSHKHVTIPTSSSTTTTQSTINSSQQQLQHDPTLINWTRQKKNDLIDTTTIPKEIPETNLDAKKAERKAWNKMTPKEQDDAYGKYINQLRVQRELEHFQQRSRQGPSWKPPDDRNHPLYGQIYKYDREINAGGTRNKYIGEAFSLDTVQFDTEIDSITQESRSFNPFMKRRRQKYKTSFDVMNDEYRKVEYAQMNFIGYNNYSLVPKSSASPSLTLGIKDGKPKLTLIEQRRREHEKQILLLSSTTTKQSYLEQLAIEGQISTDNNNNNDTTTTTETIIQSQSIHTIEDTTTETTTETTTTTTTTTTTVVPTPEIQLYADFGDKDQLSENVIQPIRTFPNLGGPSVLGEHFQHQYDEDDTIGVFTEEMYKQVTYFNSIPQPQKTTEEQLKEDNYRITDASIPKEARHTFIGVDFEAARKRDDEAYKKMMEKHNSTNNSYFRNIQRKLQENEVDHLGNPLYPELHLTKDKFEVDENGNITNLDSLITTEIDLTDNVFLFCEDAIQPHIDSRGRIVLPLYIPDATNIYGTTKPIPKPISKQHEFDSTTTKTIQKLEEEYFAPFGKRFATSDDWGYFLTRKDNDGNIDEKRPDPFKLAQVHKYQSKLDFELLEEFLFIHTDLYHIFADPALDMNLFKLFTTNLKENYSLLHPAVHRLYTNFNNVKHLTFRIYNDYESDLASQRTKSNNANNNNDNNNDNMNLPIFDELDYTPVRERWEELIDELGPDPTRFDQGVIPSSRIGSIPHLLLPGKNYQPTIDGNNNSIWADPDMGIVYVPYNVNMKSLATFIDHYGYIAIGQRTQHASFSTLYENKIREVKSYFRLKRLVRDPGVNAEAFIDCLQRMYDSRFVYGKQLDGVSLRIGFKYGFTADGWMVIPHNWQ